MKIVQMNPGRKIDYELRGTKLDFADGELRIDLARYQGDDVVTRDIMVDREGWLTTGRGRNYVAQVEIPARQYTEPAEDSGGAEDGATGGGERQPLPLNTDEVTLRLFSIDGIMIR